MLKKYVSDSRLSLSLTLGDGSRQRVRFESLTGGGSEYHTADAAVQDALARHYGYGTLYHETEPPVEAAPETETEGEAKAKELKHVTVACADDAKDYLAESLGLSRTKLRTLSAIKSAGEAHGVVFEGLE